jgi:hypothetical protein
MAGGFSLHQPDLRRFRASVRDLISRALQAAQVRDGISAQEIAAHGIGETDPC